MNTVRPKLNISPNFTSKRNSNQNFESFREFANETYFTESIPSIISDDKNYISEGLFGRTFTIPNNDGFILKVDKRIKMDQLKPESLSLERLPDDIPEINVGQAVARYGDYISVLIRQEGEEHGLNSWLGGLNNSKKTNIYLHNLRKIAAIPQEGYNQFTDEVKIVRKHGYYLDIWNANNLLLTNENINIVDVGKIKNIKGKFVSRVSKAALLRAMADETTLRELLPDLDGKKSARIGEQLDIISNKLGIAMKKSGLPTLVTFNKFIATCRDMVHPLEIERIENIISRLIKASK